MLRSVISGKKIKRKVAKDSDDKQAEINRAALLAFYNNAV